jgi:hypothetical protein
MQEVEALSKIRKSESIQSFCQKEEGKENPDHFAAMVRTDEPEIARRAEAYPARGNGEVNIAESAPVKVE